MVNQAGLQLTLAHVWSATSAGQGLLVLGRRAVCGRAWPCGLPRAFCRWRRRRWWFHRFFHRERISIGPSCPLDGVSAAIKVVAADAGRWVFVGPDPPFTWMHV